MTLESLECPNCGAALAVNGRADLVTCTYCSSTIRLATAEGGALVPHLEARGDAGGPDAAGEILALVRSGRKIDAIKLYRTRTGAGLKEAKEAVEALERNARDTAVLAALRSAPPPAARAVAPDEALGQIVALLRAGHKIEAIKVYRTHTGAGLKESKEAVEALERNPQHAAVLAALRAGPAHPGMTISPVAPAGAKPEGWTRGRVIYMLVALAILGLGIFLVSQGFASGRGFAFESACLVALGAFLTWNAWYVAHSPG